MPTTNLELEKEDKKILTGSEIRDKRILEAKMSIEHLAEELKVTKSYISMIENDLVIPSEWMVNKILSVFEKRKKRIEEVKNNL